MAYILAIMLTAGVFLTGRRSLSSNHVSTMTTFLSAVSATNAKPEVIYISPLTKFID